MQIKNKDFIKIFICGVGEAVNTRAFHARIHGFKSRTPYQMVIWSNGYDGCLSRSKSGFNSPYHRHYCPVAKW